MEESAESEYAYDELKRNPRHNLTISRTGIINEFWEYEFTHKYKEPESIMGYTFAKQIKINPVSVRARKLDGKYLLEERYKAGTDYFSFGIEELNSPDKADERLIEKIKSKAAIYRDQNTSLRNIEIKFNL